VDVQPLAPAIALVGTVTVGLLGFYQWRKQYSNPNRATNAAARREAYEGLWQKLELINIELRIELESARSLPEQLREINSYFIAHSLHFEDRDQIIINDYVRAMNVVQEKIIAAGDNAFLENYRQTAFEQPPGVRELGRALYDAGLLRQEIKKRVQKVAASV
jgi:hypothetical protein